ncbi:MAG TPA: putative metal-binding motif-containing protein, partial [Polyangiaceae bacterium]|nr:putative metal-binding motif-containing protein [Polyangiaceae bacterium]
ETCNGKDDDCNNVVDDNAAGAVAQCPDADNDMYCAANCKVACSPPAGYRPQVQCLAGADCNDNSAAVHPGAVELCGDGVDSNCTGGDNETFANLGTACTAGNTGVCKRKGTFVCSADKKSTVCNAKIVTPQSGSAAPSTDTDIDLSTAHAGYNPAWDWNCDGNVTADTLVQEGSFRAAACGGDYVGACSIYSQAECGQGGFLGATFFNCESPGGFYLSGNQYCGHYLNYVGCLFDFYSDSKCDYLTNTYTANNQQLTCE